ncbi:MAG: hypothetical protein LBC35_01865 [Coriobacteriales bacterium]|jgi:HPt (histidine-containing phosphotransfer) domain-containing protein|nr:hypothetical protein [Coriobacteriales bacterium]
MTESTAVDQVLANTQIAGLDIPEALARMGNSSKMYLRIIHSFITNMPNNLEELSTVTAETLNDYAIKVHGAKGSCYGIGANACGDKARALELASKAGDLDTVLRDNGAFLESVRSLVRELEKLEAAVADAENTGVDKTVAVRPDPITLSALLAATQAFDIDQMQGLIDELTAMDYQQDGDVITYIKERFEAFDYQAIEEKIVASI